MRGHRLRTLLPAVRRANLPEQLPNLLFQVLALAPAANAELAAGLLRFAEQGSGRVPKQVHVGRPMDIGFHHKRIAARGKRFARLFLRRLVSGGHDQPINIAQKLRSRKSDVARDRPALVASFVEACIAVPHHLAHRRVLVGQFLKPIEVAAKALLENGKDENPPHVHARPSDSQVGALAEVRLKQRKQRLLLLLVAPDRLQPLENRRDVVAAIRVEFDALDRNRTEILLEFKDVSHNGNPREESAKNTCIGAYSRILYCIR